jgi:hypothetical protein
MHQFIVDRARRDETAFRLKLVVAGIEIKKTEDDYCNVDFEILHGERAVGYIELKTRYCDTSRYPDLFIGAVKLHAINADFPNTFLVWDDKFSGTLYWCKFDESLLKCATGWNGGAVFQIPKTRLCRGFDTLNVALLEVIAVSV